MIKACRTEPETLKLLLELAELLLLSRKKPLISRGGILKLSEEVVILLKLLLSLSLLLIEKCEGGILGQSGLLKKNKSCADFIKR